MGTLYRTFDTESVGHLMNYSSFLQLCARRSDAGSRVSRTTGQESGGKWCAGRAFLPLSKTVSVKVGRHPP